MQNIIDLDAATNRNTAHSTYADLLAATAGGWAPSLRRQGEQLAIGMTLERDGRRVYWK